MPSRFDDKLRRLKSSLGVSRDNEAAAALGLTAAALSERKRRDAFPDDRLLALVAKRPELGIDPDFVLSGVHRALSQEEVARLKEVHQSMALTQVNAARAGLYRRLMDQLDLTDEASVELLIEVAARLRRVTD